MFFGRTITLPTNTPTDMYVLIKAVLPEFPLTATELQITPNNGNTGDVLIGDAAISVTNYGLPLAPGIESYRSTGEGGNSIQLIGLYVLAVAAGQKIHVLARTQ